jgi:hypothetical protein
VKSIVAYSLKTITVEPEKELLLTNGSEITFFSRQRLGRHVIAETDKHATIGVLLETVFSTRSDQRGCKEDNWGNRVSSVWEFVRKRSSKKKAAVQRGIEPGSRGIVVVRSRHQATTEEDTAGWKRLVKCGNQRWCYN